MLSRVMILALLSFKEVTVSSIEGWALVGCRP